MGKTHTYDPPTGNGQPKMQRQGVTFSERIGHALLPLHKVASGLLPARRAQDGDLLQLPGKKSDT